MKIETKVKVKAKSLQPLARLPGGCSGAELEGLVKDAAAYALNRQVDPNDLSKPVDEEAIKVSTVSFSTPQRLECRFGAVGKHRFGVGDLLTYFIFIALLSCHFLR